MKHLKLCALALLFTAPATSFSEQIIQPSLLDETENIVQMDDGRMFVAGSTGIHEIKSTNDSSPNCQQDSQSGLTICTVVEPMVNGNECSYTGMTTDNYYLYASCTKWQSSTFADPEFAAFLRILPGTHGAEQVIAHEYDEPIWYNGMTMFDDDSLLMTKTVPDQGSIKAAIVKLDITNQLTSEFTVSKWFPSNSLLFAPNGIKYDNGFVYFVGGQNLFRIEVNEDQTHGFPFHIYQTALHKALDDFAIVGDWIAVAETALINGWGTNNVLFVHKTGTVSTTRIPTGKIQMSHFVKDSGTLFSDDLIGTSFYQGGLYRIPMP